MTTAPKWLTVVGVIALLWNLMGVAAIGADIFMPDMMMAGLTSTQRELAAMTPRWAQVGSMIAVGMGTLGAIGLIMRRAWAVPVFILSLAGVIVQDVWLFALSNTVDAYGNSIIAFQAGVMGIAILLIWLARGARGRGWLE